MNKLTYALFILVFISCVDKEDEQPMEGEVQYEVTFTSLWTKDAHPTNYPGRPHFSGLIGATHKKEITFWEVGDSPTPGIESMAETGSKSLLSDEIESQIDSKNADQVISGSGHDAPNSVSVTFIANSTYPYLTLVSMVAPSPDWFVGLSGFQLMDAEGAWITDSKIDLKVYDAGGDTGTTFEADNVDQNPKGKIQLLTSNQGDTDFRNGLPIIGTYTIKQVK